VDLPYTYDLARATTKNWQASNSSSCSTAASTANCSRRSSVGHAQQPLYPNQLASCCSAQA